MAQQLADAAEVETAILHRDNIVTEATSANILIARDGTLFTHPADQWILGGISRQIILDLARDVSIPVRQEAYTLDAMRSADEVLICGTTKHIGPVSAIDGQVIGNGHTRPIAQRLHEAFVSYVTKQCLM